MKIGITNIALKIKDNLYLIIPIICIGALALIHLFFIPKKFTYDFRIYYTAGKQVMSNPVDLYKIKGFYYTPFSAIFFGLSISLFPFDFAYLFWSFMNYLFGVFFLLEFNRILILMEINRRQHRFLFLIILSNGWLIYEQFFYNQVKFLLIFILLFILRREMLWKAEEKEKNFNDYLINCTLFIFVINMGQYLALFLLIFIFHDVKFHEIF